MRIHCRAFGTLGEREDGNATLQIDTDLTNKRRKSKRGESKRLQINVDAHNRQESYGPIREHPRGHRLAGIAPEVRNIYHQER